PPSSTNDPGTRPPPSTRSSSAMPVGRRGDWSSFTWLSEVGAAAPNSAPAGPGPVASSTSEFHSPHSGQRPSHLAAHRPHFWQTYCDLILAICRNYLRVCPKVAIRKARL